MRIDRQDRSLCVKMSNVGHLHAAGGDAQSGVLDGLELFDVGRLAVGEPDGGCISEEGPDE